MTEQPNAALDSGFFNGRFMVEIKEWNWNLDVRLSPSATPIEHRFQGVLHYNRGLEIAGHVRAPHAHRGKRMSVWLSPYGPDIDLAASGLDPVGRFYRNQPPRSGADFDASLHLPGSALEPAITCLSSVWRFLDIWTVDEDADETPVTAFCFSASVHPNLAAWAGPELMTS